MLCGLFYRQGRGSLREGSLGRWGSVLNIQGDLGDFPAASGTNPFVVDGAVDGCGYGDGYGDVPDCGALGHLMVAGNIYLILLFSLNTQESHLELAAVLCIGGRLAIGKPW